MTQAIEPVSESLNDNAPLSETVIRNIATSIPFISDDIKSMATELLAARAEITRLSALVEDLLKIEIIKRTEYVLRCEVDGKVSYLLDNEGDMVANVESAMAWPNSTEAADFLKIWVDPDYGEDWSVETINTTEKMFHSRTVQLIKGENND